MKRINWNAISDSSLNGVSFHWLLKRWAERAAEGDDVTERIGAQTLLGLLRIVEHPDDCAECAAIHARRDAEARDDVPDEQP